jgi:ubiquinone biosynthesis protein
MRITSWPQFARHLNRITEIITTLSKYGLADWVDRLNIGLLRGLYRHTVHRALADLSTEARIRLTLTELGTTFIKLGQLLSTRPDLIGTKLADELTQLQTNVPGDPPEVIRTWIERGLGRPIPELFADFDDQPLASASIAQVHTARLHDGTPVVLKVQHPGIVDRIRNDLEILRGLAERAEQYIEELKPYQPTAIVREFERTITRELDFLREMRNLERFRAAFASDATVQFPKPYPEFCTARVLTMDRLVGVSFAELARMPPSDESNELARRGARLFLEMIFRDGFYHADPHPGNLLLLPDGVLGVLDVGMVGQLTPTLRHDLTDLLFAIGSGDSDEMVTILTRLSQPATIHDPADFAADVSDFLSYYQGVPLNRIDISAALNRITEIVRRHRLILPTGIALLIRVLVVLEGTSRLLKPDFRLNEVLDPFRQRLLAERLSPWRRWQRFRDVLHDYQVLMSRFPEQLRDILQKAQAGRIEVQLEHHHLEPSVNRLVLGVITAAMILGSSILWAFKAPPTLGGVSVIGLLGMMASAISGIRLIRAILRSRSFEG